MGVGPQGPQGPAGPIGPSGDSVDVDPNKVIDILSNNNTILNRLSSNIVNNINVSNSISDNISKSPNSISNLLAKNVNFQNSIGDNVIQNSTNIGDKIADSIISDKNNILKLTSTMSSRYKLIDDLAYTLSNPSLPYQKYLQGQQGNITNIKNAMKPLTMVCDTIGNCKTPITDFYLNFTSGNLLFNNKDKSSSFRVSNDGSPWIAGNKGGVLGTYDDNLNVGNVAVKWDAQGNVMISDLSKTTGSLKVGGDMYLKHLYANGFLTAINTININTTDGSSYVEGIFHVGTPGYHTGISGITDGSTFNITKNGPYRNNNGGKNTIVFNNYNNPYIFGDASTLGNIYMLNNNNNIANIKGSELWSKGITGSGNLKNNAAIINNTGVMEGINGSLMLIGNAVEDNTNRIVEIKDKLRIGSWIFSENTSGSLEISNLNNINNNIKLDDVLNAPGNINGIYFNENTIGTSIINNGHITTSNLNGVNLISNNIKANNININGDLKISDTITVNNNIRGNRYESNNTLNCDRINCDSLEGNGNINTNKVNCRKDATVNWTILSDSDIMLRANVVRAEGRITKWGGGDWLAENLCGDHGCEI